MAQVTYCDKCGASDKAQSIINVELQIGDAADLLDLCPSCRYELRKLIGTWLAKEREE